MTAYHRAIVGYALVTVGVTLMLINLLQHG